MEFGVAIMLIALGILNLTAASASRTERVTPPAPMHGHPHAHLHAHDDEEVLEHQHRHAHLHGHGTDERLGLSRRSAGISAPGRRRAVHGLAGSAAIALLVLATIQDTGAALGIPPDLLRRRRRRDGVLTTVIGLPFWVASLDRRRSTAG